MIRRGEHIILPGGNGTHVAQFLYWDEETEPYGLTERHRHSSGDGFHGGYLAWRDPAGAGEIRVHHELLSADPAHLTIQPSLSCAFLRGDGEGEPCTSHGWIRDGRWEDA